MGPNKIDKLRFRMGKIDDRTESNSNLNNSFEKKAEHFRIIHCCMVYRVFRLIGDVFSSKNVCKKTF